MNPNTLIILAILTILPWALIGWIQLIKLFLSPFKGLGKKILKKWAESNLEDD